MNDRPDGEAGRRDRDGGPWSPLGSSSGSPDERSPVGVRGGWREGPRAGGPKRDAGEARWRSDEGAGGAGGDRPPAQPIFIAPPVLMWILGLFWISYAAVLLAGPALIGLIETYAALSPARFLAGPAANGGLAAMLAPLVGHMLLHADLLHIGANSLWFLAFGAPVMRRLAAGGRHASVFLPSVGAAGPAPGRASVLFVILFALSGAAGGLAFVLANPASGIPMVGASSGVSGLLGAVVRLMNRRAAVFAPGPRPLAPLDDSAVLVWSVFIVATNIAVGVFGVGFGENGPNIAWEAHLGGYFFGLFAFPVFDRLSRSGGARA